MEKPMEAAIEGQEADHPGTVARVDGGALLGKVCVLVVPRRCCEGDDQDSRLSGELPPGWGGDGPGNGWLC